MPEYLPKSAFLRAVIAGDAPLSGGETGDWNLRLLIEMTRDNDLSNRDWATFLLSIQEADSPEIREALFLASQDADIFVRAEAVCGLAQRDTNIALPLVQKALQADNVALPIFEAAELCAHPSLIRDLRRWAQPSDEPELDRCAAVALAACENVDAHERGQGE